MTWEQMVAKQAEIMGGADKVFLYCPLDMAESARVYLIPFGIVVRASELVDSPVLALREIPPSWLPGDAA